MRYSVQKKDCSLRGFRRHISCAETRQCILQDSSSKYDTTRQAVERIVVLPKTMKWILRAAALILVKCSYRRLAVGLGTWVAFPFVQDQSLTLLVVDRENSRQHR